jgi:hypothetical protein
MVSEAFTLPEGVNDFFLHLPPNLAQDTSIKNYLVSFIKTGILGSVIY